MISKLSDDVSNAMFSVYFYKSKEISQNLDKIKELPSIFLESKNTCNCTCKIDLFLWIAVKGNSRSS